MNPQVENSEDTKSDEKVIKMREFRAAICFDIARFLNDEFNYERFLHLKPKGMNNLSLGHLVLFSFEQTDINKVIDFVQKEREKIRNNDNYIQLSVRPLKLKVVRSSAGVCTYMVMFQMDARLKEFYETIRTDEMDRINSDVCYMDLHTRNGDTAQHIFTAMRADEYYIIEEMF